VAGRILSKRLGVAAAAVAMAAVLVTAEIFIIRSASNYEAEAEIIYAARNIEKGVTIEADMLEMRKVGLKYLHRQSMRSMNDAIGKKAGVEILQGEMLLSSKLGKEDDIRIQVKDSSNRLFSVAFNGDQANGWQLSPGQYVDIIFVPGDIMKGGIQNTLMKNIRIAAVIDERGKIFEGSDGVSTPKYISFEVTEEQAGFLASAKSMGKLELAIVLEK
jgi:Flp pilus assembly protein CpaB